MPIKRILNDLAYSVYLATGGSLVRPPRPLPEPAGYADIPSASSALLDKLDELGDRNAQIWLPDAENKIYKFRDVQDYLAADETSRIKYLPELQDCDEYAAILFGKFAGLVWTNVHALNWFFDENLKVWFIEPQTDQIAPKLENWQGWDVQFFIGR